MNKPLISIIIPVFNGSKYLKSSIDSAINQDYENVEIIVINDGSNDDGITESIIYGFGSKIIYKSKKNGGVASALNLGINISQGDYISWLSHDDIYLPNKISSQLHLISQLNNKTILCSNIDIINEEGKIVQKKFFNLQNNKNFIYSLFTEHIINGCSLLIHKDIFKENGLFNENLKYTQDYDMWFRLYNNGYNFKFITESLIQSRHHKGQDSRNKDKFIGMIQEECLIYKPIIKNIGFIVLSKGGFKYKVLKNIYLKFFLILPLLIIIGKSSIGKSFISFLRKLKA